MRGQKQKSAHTPPETRATSIQTVDAVRPSDYARYMVAPAHLHTEPVANASPAPGDQHRALTSGVAVIDRSDVGRLVVAGEDALDLLNRLSTNELATLEPGSGAATVLTTNKGRIIDLLRVHRDETRLVVFTSPGNRRRVAEWIDFYTFVEDVTVEDATAETAMLSLTGPDAAALLDGLANAQISSLPPWKRLGAQVGTVSADVYRNDFLGTPSFDIVVDAGQKSGLFAALTGEGAVPADGSAVEAVRVERGIPAFGKELTEDYNPHEANLVHHVSFSKGCYIGQEVIARLQTYQKVSKYLVGLRWRGDGLEPGSFLAHDGKRVGIVTSVARVPHTGANVGLGYVRKQFAAPGQTVAGDGGNEIRIKVLD